mgnify:CR=1 FL=1
MVPASEAIVRLLSWRGREEERVWEKVVDLLIGLKQLHRGHLDESAYMGWTEIGCSASGSLSATIPAPA